jgi:hypothetical protein
MQIPGFNGFAGAFRIANLRFEILLVVPFNTPRLTKPPVAQASEPAVSPASSRQPVRLPATILCVRSRCIVGVPQFMWSRLSFLLPAFGLSGYSNFRL